MPVTELETYNFASRLAPNLYKLSQSLRFGSGNYDSMIVAAYSEETAKLFHPDGGYIVDDSHFGTYESRGWLFGTELDHGFGLTIEYIGTAAPGTSTGVILSSRIV